MSKPIQSGTTTEAIHTLSLTKEQIVEAHTALQIYGSSLFGENYMMSARAVWAIADEIERQLPECFEHLLTRRPEVV